jgi:hypothetical protein
MIYIYQTKRYTSFWTEEETGLEMIALLNKKKCYFYDYPASNKENKDDPWRIDLTLDFKKDDIYRVIALWAEERTVEKSYASFLIDID